MVDTKREHCCKCFFYSFVTDEGLKIVGTLIPKSCMEILRQELSSDAENTEELTF